MKEINLKDEPMASQADLDEFLKSMTRASKIVSYGIKQIEEIVKEPNVGEAIGLYIYQTLLEVPGQMQSEILDHIETRVFKMIGG